MLVTQYDKSHSLTQRNKLSARFLPKRLVQLIEYILVIYFKQWSGTVLYNVQICSSTQYSNNVLNAKL
jgi:hypothetical protein